MAWLCQIVEKKDATVDQCVNTWWVNYLWSSMSNFLTSNRKLLLHIAFWLVYASFFFYQLSFGRRGEPDWSRIIPDFTFHISGLLVISLIERMWR